MIIPKFTVPRRLVTKVFIHCSASDRAEHDDAKVIDSWHKDRGFDQIGYHYFIKKTGEVQEGRPLNLNPAAQKGHNLGTIAICVSGLRDFTPASMVALRVLCKEINSKYVGLTFHGHKEVEPNKECPVFDYKSVLELDAEGHMGPMHNELRTV